MKTRVEWVDAARKECERRRPMVPEAGYEEGWIEAADWLFRQQKLNKHDVSGRSEQLPQSYVQWLTDAEREAGTQAEIFTKAEMEGSANCSGAMAFAYRYSRETYEKMLSGNCH